MRCTRTRGKKGVTHDDPEDPPRRRANQAVGHGTWDSDRPPICGVYGRTSARLFVRVGHRNWASELVYKTVVPLTKVGVTVNTDEWSGYKPLTRTGRRHVTVNHKAGEWARDADGDGVAEVHCNTIEGLWAGLRNFLRPFRGVNKVYLEQYIKMFEWSFNLKAVTDGFLRVLLGPRSADGRRGGRRTTARRSP